MNKLLREPLLHFLLLGAGLFALQAWVGGRNTLADDEIVIGEGQVANLAAGFARLRQRPPSPAELDGLIAEAVREEIFYREALALGLGEDDMIVRRRLMQKLAFLSEDTTPVPEPTDAQLQAYLDANRARFSRPRRYSLDQVYLNPQRRGAALEADARALLARLRGTGADADIARLGDRFLLETRLEDTGADEVARLYGTEFEAALQALPVGTWQGPVLSGYGAHLVLLRQRDAVGKAALADVREQVHREWQYAQRTRANDRFYADLRERYDIRIERPRQGGGASARAAGQAP